MRLYCLKRYQALLALLITDMGYERLHTLPLRPGEAAVVVEDLAMMLDRTTAPGIPGQERGEPSLVYRELGLKEGSALLRNEAPIPPYWFAR